MKQGLRVVSTGLHQDAIREPCMRRATTLMIGGNDLGAALMDRSGVSRLPDELNLRKSPHHHRSHSQATGERESHDHTAKGAIRGHVCSCAAG